MFVVSPTIVANVELQTSKCLHLQQNNNIQHFYFKQNKNICTFSIYGARDYINLAS